MRTNALSAFERGRSELEDSLTGRLSIPLPPPNAPTRITRATQKKMMTRSQSPTVRVPLPTHFNNKQFGAEDPIPDSVFNRLKKMHTNCMKKSATRTMNLNHAESAVRRFGLDEAVSKEIAFFGADILRHVLTHINDSRGWNLGRVHQLLPRIKDVLHEPECVHACMEALQHICGQMIDKLTHYAENQPSIGVDVAAEDRQKKANECIKVLRHMYNSRDDYYKKLSVDDVDQLHTLMTRLERL